MPLSFPLSSVEITLWLGLTAVLLLVTSELISPYYGRTGMVISKKKFRQVALILSLLFFVKILVEIYTIFTY